MTIQTKHSSLKSDVDIDIYFDSLNLGASDKEISDLDASDFDIEELDSLDFEFSDLESVLPALKQSVPAEGFCLPAVFDRNNGISISSRTFSEADLARVACEISLLSEQIKKTPSATARAIRFFIPMAKRELIGFLRASRLPIGVLGMFLGIFCLYGYGKNITFKDLYLAIAQGWDTPQADVSQTRMLLQDRTARNTGHSLQAVTASESFREAVNKATNAAELTQTAKTEKEWNAVANSWLEAISLMNSIPQAHLKYTVAVQKVEEYARNLAYAQGQMRTAATLQETTVTLEMSR